MTQSIVRLPESANISIDEWNLIIDKHKIITEPKLFCISDGCNQKRYLERDSKMHAKIRISV